MAFLEADYLTDIIGRVEEHELKGFIVYVPKLKRNVILSVDLHNALDDQGIESSQSIDVLKRTALEIFEELRQEGKFKEEHGL